MSTETEAQTTATAENNTTTITVTTPEPSATVTAEPTATTTTTTNTTVEVTEDDATTTTPADIIAPPPTTLTISTSPKIDVMDGDDITPPSRSMVPPPTEPIKKPRHVPPKAAPPPRPPPKTAKAEDEKEIKEEGEKEKEKSVGEEEEKKETITNNDNNDDDGDDGIERPDLLGLKALSFSQTDSEGAGLSVSTDSNAAATTTTTSNTNGNGDGEGRKRKSAAEIEAETTATIQEVSAVLESNPGTPEAKNACYAKLLECAKRESFGDLDKAEFLYNSGRDSEGRSVVVLIGCRVPADTVPYERLLLYFVRTLDVVTEGLYSIIYIAGNQSSANRPAVGWLYKAYGVLPRRYKKNIKRLLIVQCSMWVKLLLGMCYPFISKKFWSKLFYVSSAADLAKHVRPHTVHFPSSVILSFFPPAQQSSSSSSSSSEQKPLLFGRPLSEVAECPELMRGGVPVVVYDCLKFLMARGTSSHGILRLSGDREAINECVACYNLGNFPNYSAIPSPHTVVNLLKYYLRELPEPLIPQGIYGRLIEAFKAFQEPYQKLSREQQQQSEVDLAKTFGAILEDLPQVNRTVLYNLFCFLVLVGFNKETTNMPPTNIATCIGPSIMWMHDDDGSGPLDPVKILYDTQNSNNIARVLVIHHEYIPKARCLFDAPDTIKEKIGL